MPDDSIQPVQTSSASDPQTKSEDAASVSPIQSTPTTPSPQQQTTPPQQSPAPQNTAQSDPANTASTATPGISSTPTGQSNLTPSSSGTDPVTVSAHVPRKYGGRKVIATIFGILLLIGGVTTGVYLVQNQQLLPSRAWDCNNYVFEITESGEVKVRNGSTRNEPKQEVKVFINDSLSATFDAPALKAGEAATLGTVTLPSEQDYTWKVEGSKDCKNNGKYEYKKPDTEPPVGSVAICHIPPEAPHNAHVIVVSKNSVEYSEHVYGHHEDFIITEEEPFPRAGTSCAEPTATPTEPPATPTSPPTGASCSDVKAYDTSWNLLTESDLSNLEVGTIVRFAVSGSTSQGSISKARFTINGTQRDEVTTQRVETGEYYDDYQIPENVTSFTVGAQLYHSELGWF